MLIDGWRRRRRQFNATCGGRYVISSLYIAFMRLDIYIFQLVLYRVYLFFSQYTLHLTGFTRGGCGIAVCGAIRSTEWKSDIY